MSNKDKILVGQFGSPVGLSGEIKVIIMTSTFEAFKNLNSYTNFDESLHWKFSKISLRSKRCVAQLNNTFSREEALKLKGQKIYSNKKYFPDIKENEYYITDLVGCKLVIKSNNKIGEVIDIKNYGAGDLLEAKLNNKIFLIPFNKENLISVDLKNKVIIINPIPGLLD